MAVVSIFGILAAVDVPGAIIGLVQTRKTELQLILFKYL
jgi:hypothetical protein